MSKIVPNSFEGGNTKTPSQHQIAPSLRWCFTLNNWTKQESSSLYSMLSTKAKFAIVGEETGEQGTPHLQGYVEFKTKCRPKNLASSRIHWEKAKGSKIDNINYCSKEKTAFSIGMPKPIKVIDTLRGWQADIEKITLSEPDERKIYWYWEDVGGVGKSVFAKYMVVKHKSLFCSGGKYSDIMNLVFNQDMENTRTVIFDIPRSHQGRISYASLESIKNGMVCNTKYETGVKLFNSPHVIIFANYPPEDPDSLSQDRWVIRQLE